MVPFTLRNEAASRRVRDRTPKALSEDGDWRGTEEKLWRPEAGMDESLNGRIQAPRFNELE